MKIKWQERKILWKRRPLYRIMCCYLLNMCYEKKKKRWKNRKKNKKTSTSSLSKYSNFFQSLMLPLFIEPVTSLDKCRVAFYWVIKCTLRNTTQWECGSVLLVKHVLWRKKKNEEKKNEENVGKKTIWKKGGKPSCACAHPRVQHYQLLLL
jgi:hypothetical protein